jgi:hypothetical protein
MWHAIRHKKVEVFLARQHPDAPTAWRRAVENSEDLLTSGVFERLAYLPGTAAMEVVLRAVEVRGGRFVPVPEAILESLAWPHPGEDERIEPDWIWLTESYVVVFEAKWGRGVVPLPSQLEDQARVCSARWSGRPMVHVAVVQSGNIEVGPDRWSMTWANLRAQAIRKLSATEERSVRRILRDMADVLDSRGVASVWFDTLAALRVDGLIETFATPVRPKLLPALSDLTIDPEAYGEPWT